MGAGHWEDPEPRKGAGRSPGDRRVGGSAAEPNHIPRTSASIVWRRRWTSQTCRGAPKLRAALPRSPSNQKLALLPIQKSLFHNFNEFLFYMSSQKIEYLSIVSIYGALLKLYMHRKIPYKINRSEESKKNLLLSPQQLFVGHKAEGWIIG